jgi:biopolymer transport protein TolQ
MNILNLMLEASWVVQAVLLVLLFFSIFSWAIIFYKRRTIGAAFSRSELFLRAFRKSKNLSEVNEAARRFHGSPLVPLFQAGFLELTHLSKANPQKPPSAKSLESLSRVLMKASNVEITRLEKRMGFLATTGSVTPFIGLFGTVWGIMDAFLKIGIVRSASLMTVAPGIAEALIATAVGLFAAIPAVIAYNHFLHRIKDLITEMEDFTLEFLNIADRLYGS